MKIYLDACGLIKILETQNKSNDDLDIYDSTIKTFDLEKQDLELVTVPSIKQEMKQRVKEEKLKEIKNISLEQIIDKASNSDVKLANQLMYLSQKEKIENDQSSAIHKEIESIKSKRNITGFITDTLHQITFSPASLYSVAKKMFKEYDITKNNKIDEILISLDEKINNFLSPMLARDYTKHKHNIRNHLKTVDVNTFCENSDKKTKSRLKKHYLKNNRDNIPLTNNLNLDTALYNYNDGTLLSMAYMDAMKTNKDVTILTSDKDFISMVQSLKDNLPYDKNDNCLLDAKLHIKHVDSNGEVSTHTLPILNTSYNSSKKTIKPDFDHVLHKYFGTLKNMDKEEILNYRLEHIKSDNFKEYIPVNKRIKHLGMGVVTSAVSYMSAYIGAKTFNAIYNLDNLDKLDIYEVGQALYFAINLVPLALVSGLWAYDSFKTASSKYGIKIEK
jgi:hypothetical protein